MIIINRGSIISRVTEGYLSCQTTLSAVAASSADVSAAVAGDIAVVGTAVAGIFAAAGIESAEVSVLLTFLLRQEEIDYRSSPAEYHWTENYVLEADCLIEQYSTRRELRLWRKTLLTRKSFLSSF